MQEEFLECSLLEDKENLKNEILGFIADYNEHRAHSSLNGLTLLEFSIKKYRSFAPASLFYTNILHLINYNLNKRFM